MHGTHLAEQAGASAPTSDEAHGAPHAAGPRDQQAGTDFHCDGAAAQASAVIEGEADAAALMERVTQGIAHPDALLTLVTFLGNGQILAGCCRAIQKQLEGSK